MKILYIGGNGNISWWCVQKSLEMGHKVYELNRAQTRRTRRDVQQEVHQIIGDIRNITAVEHILADEKFDVVCDFITYNEQQAKNMVTLFIGKCNQYIFISSEAVYKRKYKGQVFTEESERYNPNNVDAYISGKILAENVFINAYEKEQFPATIVRPGYTYDTIIPTPLGQNCFTASEKLLEGYPMLMLGDGENIWTPTHSSDFSEAFKWLIGNKACIGETYQIMSDKSIRWKQMTDELMDALEIKEKKYIFIPEEDAIRINCFHSMEIQKQRMSDYLFDIRKIKKLCPEWEAEVLFRDGIRRTVEWLMEDDAHRRIVSEVNKNLELLYKKYMKAG